MNRYRPSIEIKNWNGVFVPPTPFDISFVISEIAANKWWRMTDYERTVYHLMQAGF